MIKEPTERPALQERLMLPEEVAQLLVVEVSTVKSWARSGRVPSKRTPGGHYRFEPVVVEALLREGWTEDEHSEEPVAVGA
ncbi:helix-turn-helix domain-containing protein [Nonomuraea endophytica]|uniref:helix-turn-helix domain-containing protein n=1 Tax=Nonomuraea endophytica TaxID=714136 RepID=UPI0037C756F8